MKPEDMSNAELDAAVAEKVMGFKWWRVRDDHPTPPYFVLLPGDSKWCERHGKRVDRPDDPSLEADTGSCPKYSTDIAAAWEVVEKMLPLLGHVYPSFYNNGKIMHWCAVIESGPSSRSGCIAKTLPRAICLAALAAVEAKEKTNG